MACCNILNDNTKNKSLQQYLMHQLSKWQKMHEITCATVAATTALTEYITHPTAA